MAGPRGAGGRALPTRAAGLRHRAWEEVARKQGKGKNHLTWAGQGHGGEGTEGMERQEGLGA